MEIQFSQSLTKESILVRRGFTHESSEQKIDFNEFLSMENWREEKVTTSTNSLESIDIKPSILKKFSTIKRKRSESMSPKCVSIDESQNLVILIEPTPHTSIFDAMCSCSMY